jgi:hypothetical protein
MSPPSVRSRRFRASPQPDNFALPTGARDVARLIHCECRHSMAAHGANGCTATDSDQACPCPKSASDVVFDEIELLRPQWIAVRHAPAT